MAGRGAATLIAAALLCASLVACGGKADSDSKAPQVVITSTDSSATASYQLTGVTVDNIGVTSASYTLAGGSAVSLSLADGAFSSSLTLAPGRNHIVVSATDAAGNTGDAAIDVSFTSGPSGLSIDRDIANWGETVTIRGDDLGETGTVSIGSIEVSGATWEPGSVSFVIPAAAPNGPQQATISNSAGSGDVSLFIGVDFETGTLEQLVALGLPAGTAVRLGAGTFASTTPDLQLAGYSFYGQGSADTILTTTTGINALTYNFQPGRQVVLQDLTLKFGTMRTLRVPAAAGSAVGTAALVLPELAELVESAVESLQLQQLSSQASVSSLLSLNRVNVEMLPGGFGLVTIDTVLSPPVMVDDLDVNFSSVKFTSAASSALALMTAGDITIEGSDIEVGQLILAAVGSELQVNDSDFLVTGANATVIIGGDRGTTFTESTVRTIDANVQFIPMGVLMGGGAVFPPSSSLMSGSTISANDSTPGTAPDIGSVLMYLIGESDVQDNNIGAARGLGILSGFRATVFSGNEVTLGGPGIVAAELAIQSMSNDYVEVQGNTVSFLSTGGVSVGGEGDGGFHFNDNTVTGHSTSGTALSVQLVEPDEPFSFTATGNTFNDFAGALSLTGQAGATEEFTVSITGNTFDFPISAAPQVATVDDVEDLTSTLDASNNVWGSNTDLATVQGYVTYLGVSVAGSLNLDPLGTP